VEDERQEFITNLCKKYDFPYTVIDVDQLYSDPQFEKITDLPLNTYLGASPTPKI